VPCRLGPLPSSGLSIHDSARCGRPLSCSRSRDRRQPGRTTPTGRLGHRPAGQAWIGGLHRCARLAHTQHRAERSLTPSRSPYSTRAMGSYCCFYVAYRQGCAAARCGRVRPMCRERRTRTSFCGTARSTCASHDPAAVKYLGPAAAQPAAARKHSAAALAG